MNWTWGQCTYLPVRFPKQVAATVRGVSILLHLSRASRLLIQAYGKRKSWLTVFDFLALTGLVSCFLPPTSQIS